MSKPETIRTAQKARVILYDVLTLDYLEPDERYLIIAAREATHMSHSPYSKFRVGCAVQLDNDDVVTGANQENASYGGTVCAERTTIFAVHNMGRKKDVVKLAVTGRIGTMPEETYRGQPVPPCGLCRQVIKESEDLHGSPLIILCDGYNNDEILRFVGVESILPWGFSGKDFGMNLHD
jgi:cytidine deaminase